MPVNKELYKQTLDSFGVAKPSKLLTDQAKLIASGEKANKRIIKMEVARLKLLEKPSVTPKQQERINKLTQDIENVVEKSGRKPPVDPRNKEVTI
jgi:hypothetical protein